MRGSHHDLPFSSSDIRPRNDPLRSIPAPGNGRAAEAGAHRNGDVAPPAGPAPGDVTALLAELGRGNETAREPLFDRVYGELRMIARARLRADHPDRTLGTTDLVHETYLRLVRVERLEWTDRSHFFAVAARAMRRILIDRARAAHRLKRRSGRRVSLDGAAFRMSDAVTLNADDLIALDEALDRLGALSERQRQTVELRFFAGLTFAETAQALGVGLNTVKRDWSTARVWLNRELRR
jgi:RNA polymerase sigma factor (TIGR02999 family)